VAAPVHLAAGQSGGVLAGQRVDQESAGRDFDGDGAGGQGDRIGVDHQPEVGFLRRRELGDDTTLLIIEAMKTMNPIAAPRDGKVLSILVGDAQPVEFGESLLLLE